MRKNHVLWVIFLISAHVKVHVCSHIQFSPCVSHGCDILGEEGVPSIESQFWNGHTPFATSMVTWDSGVYSEQMLDRHLFSCSNTLWTLVRTRLEVKYWVLTYFYILSLLLLLLLLLLIVVVVVVCIFKINFWSSFLITCTKWTCLCEPWYPHL